MMEHKAFLFEYKHFDSELLPILRNALATSDCTELITFIRLNFAALTDPYEGEPLAEGWEDMIDSPDAHQYGDIALTKYYSPKDDIGLGPIWEQIQGVVSNDSTVLFSPILGLVVGDPDAPFDPGKMGSYFQSEVQVRSSLEYLQSHAQWTSMEAVGQATMLLKQAVTSHKGLYLTF